MMVDNEPPTCNNLEIISGKPPVTFSGVAVSQCRLVKLHVL